MSNSTGPSERLDAVRRHLDRSPWGEGVVAGIGAFVVGYVGFLLLLIATGAVDFGRSIGTIVRSVGRYFYNAHNIPTLTRQTRVVQDNGTTVGEITRDTWQNGITGWQRIHQTIVSNGEVVQDASQTSVLPTDPTLPAEVYLLVPIVVLILVAGAFTRRLVDTSAVESPVDAIVVGVAVALSVTLGYLLVVLVGTYLFATPLGEDAFTRPARLEALGYGFLYPFACSAASAGIVIGIERGEDTTEAVQHQAESTAEEQADDDAVDGK